MNDGDETEEALPADEAALEQLTQAFDHEGVVAATLIESQARETPGPLRDVDIAAWHDPELDPAAEKQLQARLAADAALANGASEANLIMLNHESPVMRYCSIPDGERIIERDRDERVRLEARAILDYLDTAPLRELAGDP